jgi:hypothetical protein
MATLSTLETSVDILSNNTTDLLDEVTDQKNEVSQLIADAVIVSENATIIPLITMATSIIDTQTLLISHIAPGA